MSKFLVGADPELFLVDAQGKVVSAIDKLGGTKDKPNPVKELGKGFAIQEDNVLAEYNLPPCPTAENFRASNDVMLTWLVKKVGNLGLKIKVSASEIMPEDQLQDPRAMVFGCDPDFNVWTLEPNPKPYANDPRLRSAGGHVHLGVRCSKADKVMLGRLMDAYLGLWSVVVDPDTRRRELYGKAGAIRFKPYGLEYRTLSNFWIDGKAKEVFQRVVHVMNHQRRDRFDVTKYGPDIQKAINNSDVNLARSLMENFGV